MAKKPWAERSPGLAAWVAAVVGVLAFIISILSIGLSEQHAAADDKRNATQDARASAAETRASAAETRASAGETRAVDQYSEAATETAAKRPQIGVSYWIGDSTDLREASDLDHLRAAGLIAVTFPTKFADQRHTFADSGLHFLFLRFTNVGPEPAYDLQLHNIVWQPKDAALSKAKDVITGTRSPVEEGEIAPLRRVIDGTAYMLLIDEAPEFSASNPMKTSHAVQMCVSYTYSNYERTRQWDEQTCAYDTDSPQPPPPPSYGTSTPVPVRPGPADIPPR